MDVISHLPVLCEDHSVPYIFVTSRAELGAAGSTKRPTSVVMVASTAGKRKGEEGKSETDEEYKGVFDELVRVVQKEGAKVKI
jgi:H/ACA ribonucleoprotein complex subunit 2